MSGNYRAMFLTIVLMMIVFIDCSYAQNPLTVGALQQVLGKPTKIEGQGTRFETWFYGESKVFVRGEQVIAWTDNGELAKLNALPRKEEDVSKDSEKKETWPNAWTAPSAERKDEIIKEVLPGE